MRVSLWLLTLALFGAVDRDWASSSEPRGGLVPFLFEPNNGQASKSTVFIVRIGRDSVHIRANGSLIYARPAGQPNPAVVFDLIGGKQDAQITGKQSTSVMNFYSGSHGNQPRVQNWDAVRFHNVYARVDLLYRLRPEGIAYEFQVADRGDPRRIRLGIKGAHSLSLQSGDLIIKTSDGVIRHAAPVAYQTIDGNRTSVHVAFELHGSELRFRVGHYDPAYALIIDPTITFSSYLGGSGADAAYAVATDAAGSMYITGETASMNFAGTQVNASSSLAHVFVTKMNSSGAIVYTTILASSGRDSGRGIAVNSSGEVYIAGVTTGSDFPVSSAAFQKTAQGLEDAFVAHLDAGGRIVYSTYLGGPGSDTATGIAVDGSGNAYVTGWTASLKFPALGPASQRYHGGFGDAFLTKVASDGKSLLFSTLIGGSGLDVANAIALGPAGACIAGSSDSPDLATNSAYQMQPGGLTDGMIACLRTDGSAWNIIGYLGGSGDEDLTGIAQDAGGIYVTGTTSAPTFPVTSGGFQSQVAGDRDIVVCKFDSSGTQLIYSTRLGGKGMDASTAMTVDSAGRAWIAGYTLSMDYPTRNTDQNAAMGGFDGIVSEISADGSQLIFSARVGGGSDDRVYGMALAPSGEAVVVGVTASTDLAGASSSPRPALQGQSDAFVVKVRASAKVAGDFDGNGVPDLVWQNKTNYQVSVWYMGGAGGATMQSWTWLNTSGSTGWRVVAAADFNGDGVPDLVWQNEATYQVSVWYMGGAGGATMQSWAWMNASGSPGWRVVAAADFNQDGVPDLVWQNDARQLTVWYMGGSGGAVMQGWNWMNASSLPGWSVAATADFNGDGIPDLVLQNDATYQVSVWYMGGAGGAVMQSWTWMNASGSPGWRVVAAADFNGDGIPDLVWQNETTYQVSVWYMGGVGGSAMQGWNWLNASGSPGWRALN